MIKDIALMEDMLFIVSRLLWQNNIGLTQAQERIAEIHQGKYDDEQGCFVQFSNAINRLKK